MKKIFLISSIILLLGLSYALYEIKTMRDEIDYLEDDIDELQNKIKTLESDNEELETLLKECNSSEDFVPMQTLSNSSETDQNSDDYPAAVSSYQNLDQEESTSNDSFQKPTNGEFTTYELKRVMSIIGFQGVKRMRGFDSRKTQDFFNMIQSDGPLLKQININSWAICNYKKIDNYSTYNYYYHSIDRETYNTYCKELNALMLLDDVIKQEK